MVRGIGSGRRDGGELGSKNSRSRGVRVKDAPVLQMTGGGVLLPSLKLCVRAAIAGD